VSKISGLEHPHIVKIHNISYDDGVYFLVTDCIVDEFGENTNLAQYLQGTENSLSEEEIFRMLGQISDALDYAHNIYGQGKGLAHRGIKLNNILVSRGVEGIDLYLSDFGLSRIMGTGTFLTRTFKMVAESLGIEKKLSAGSVESENLAPLHASFLQSYQFLAPEQKNLGQGQTVDAKSDIYAFGILTYYLLTGDYPEGWFPMPNAVQKTLRHQWDDLVRSCLQKKPVNRPSSLVQFFQSSNEKDQSKTPKAFADVFAAGARVETSLVAAASESAEQTVINTIGEEFLRPVLQTTKLERPHLDPDPAAAFQVDSSVKQYTPEKKEEKFIQPLLTEMVVIKGGTFSRGSSDGNRDEMPCHKVTIDSFAIDIHPVTNEQFVRFMEAMGGVKDSNHNDIIRLKDSRINSSKGRFSIESGYIRHPVVGVTWYGAVAYARWIGKRLPTEAEWEIAARGGIENALYPTGDDIEKSQANFFSSDTTVVKSYPPNGYGLYDIPGNVYEWCQDWYGYNYYETSVQEPLNPAGPLQGVYRVLRGGCWKSLKEDLRVSRRHRNNPGTVNSTYGFRCAANVE
jgi:formylglycine-generating enzyme required for sulfatase activity